MHDCDSTLEQLLINKEILYIKAWAYCMHDCDSTLEQLLINKEIPTVMSLQYSHGKGPAMLTLMVRKLLLYLASPNFPSDFDVLFFDDNK